MFATSCIAGNLTADPELRHVGTNGTALVKFTIAVNDRSGQEEKVYFFNAQAWGRRAETIAEHFKKGDRIAVTCEVRQERWEDKSTGQKRVKEVHNVNGFMFPQRGGSQSSNFSAEYGTKKSKAQPQEPLTTRTLAAQLPLEDDDDIPF